MVKFSQIQLELLFNRLRLAVMYQNENANSPFKFDRLGNRCMSWHGARITSSYRRLKRRESTQHMVNTYKEINYI